MSKNKTYSLMIEKPDVEYKKYRNQKLKNSASRRKEILELCENLPVINRDGHEIVEMPFNNFQALVSFLMKEK